MSDECLRRSVTRVSHVDVHAIDYAWRLPIEQSDAIERHWRTASAANPNYFNGVVYLTSDARIDDDIARAEVFATDFKTALYWRHLGFPECGARDGFGSALIRTSDGAVLLGRQRPGHINSGLTYLPGGFIDRQDVDESGRVDLVGSVLRELEEETGLGPADGRAAPGIIVTEHGPQVSYAVTFEAEGGAEDLRAAILARLHADPTSELEDIVIARSMSDLADCALPGYAALLLATILPAG